MVFRFLVGRQEWATRWFLRRVMHRRAPKKFAIDPDQLGLRLFTIGKPIYAKELLVSIGALPSSYEIDGYAYKLAPALKSAGLGVQNFWEISRLPTSQEFSVEYFPSWQHGFLWLDDLATLANPRARKAAQELTKEWITLYGAGQTKAWGIYNTAQRVSRWLTYAPMLLSQNNRLDGLLKPKADGIAKQSTPDKAQLNEQKHWHEAFFHMLKAQIDFLEITWRKLPVGVPRFETLTILIVGRAALWGKEGDVMHLVTAFVREAQLLVDDTGALASRNPEDLLKIGTLIQTVCQTLQTLEAPLPRQLSAYIISISGVLRHLRHKNGELARFHGGGRGIYGQLDWFLANAGQVEKKQAGQNGGFAFDPTLSDKQTLKKAGYIKISAGRTSLIVDAAAPPKNKLATNAKAYVSMLAFELTSGEQPLVINSGPGDVFGEEWGHISRSRLFHSTLALEGKNDESDLAPQFGLSKGKSSSKEQDYSQTEVLSRELFSGKGSRDDIAIHIGDEKPSAAKSGFLSRSTGAILGRFMGEHKKAPKHIFRDKQMVRAVLLSHDGWVASHGLIHQRELSVIREGEEVVGIDQLLPAQNASFDIDRALAAQSRTLNKKTRYKVQESIPFAIRFHLHPRWDATLDVRDKSVFLQGGSGQSWLFRFEGAAKLVLEASVYLDTYSAVPIETKQIVLSGLTLGNKAQIRWIFTKIKDTPRR